MKTSDSAAETPDDGSRRRALRYGLVAAFAGVGGFGLGWLTRPDGRDDDSASTETPSEQPTERPTETAAATETEAATVPPLVAQFAPDVYFGRRERWFPTDPRAYAGPNSADGVLDGFDALAGYTRAFDEAGEPPNPAVFYNVAPVDDRIVAVQYWMYSVFDQFTVNFHWHDWELLQVFVDTESGDPLLLVASAHARKCPNNEFLDPDIGPDERPAVLAEVGSHSSATDVNGRVASFERYSFSDFAPDVSNGPVKPLDRLSSQPFSYGLPRDEGARVPFAVPELDGAPLADHPALPDVDAEDFVDEDVTVRSWRDLARPPGKLPVREPGTVFTGPGSPTDGDVTYELLPIDAVREAFDDFAGPQLSFEFAIPGFVEDRFADHITSVGIPWENERFADPTADVTDPNHRRAIDGAEPPSLTDRVVGRVSIMGSGPGGEVDAAPGTDGDALAPFVDVSRFRPAVEVACLLRSDPAALPTADGVFRFLHVEPGSHELVVNGPGIAPYAERFDHDGGTVRPGVDGRVTLVANEDAVVLRADRRDSTGISEVRITERFAGAVFDGRPVEDGRFAVPVHRDGRYTVEITDDDGVTGAVQVDPTRLRGEPIPDVEPGKTSLARTLSAVLADAAAVTSEFEGGREVAAGFDGAAEDAAGAAETAADGDASTANERLQGATGRLRRILERVAPGADHGYTESAAGAVRYFATDGIDRAQRAVETPIVD
ncbi:hypothetical protein OB920_15960 [Halobacteria archaeon HArc-gm2]|nr:hypothetical protein [Halobacteria archaeon HArc-gm2]